MREVVSGNSRETFMTNLDCVPVSRACISKIQNVTSLDDFRKQPNASLQLLPKAAAERRLEAVSCKALFK
jgi:hypothetical protein